MPDYERIAAQQFGDAIAEFIARRTGHVFFPYRIARSSFVPPEILEVEISAEVIGKETKRGTDPREISDSERFQFSKEEIADALTSLINIFFRGIPYRGNQIAHLPEGMPDSVEFTLEYYPRGSSGKDSLHVFGGL
ncbi:MAG: hypothetical protein JWN89_397 [Parcubacteria group bacterium]|nr:hypothetical protein [Parcubacteria group bacterium]